MITSQQPSSWSRILVLLIGLCSHATIAKGDSEPITQRIADDGQDASFHPGMNCELIAEWSESQLISVLQSEDPSDLMTFCQPEQFFHCSDYNSLLFGRATLETGPDGYHCQLTPTK